VVVDEKNKITSQKRKSKFGTNPKNKNKKRR